MLYEFTEYSYSPVTARRFDMMRADELGWNGYSYRIYSNQYV